MKIFLYIYDFTESSRNAEKIISKFGVWGEGGLRRFFCRPNVRGLATPLVRNSILSNFDVFKISQDFTRISRESFPQKDRNLIQSITFQLYYVHCMTFFDAFNVDAFEVFTYSFYPRSNKPNSIPSNIRVLSFHSLSIVHSLSTNFGPLAAKHIAQRITFPIKV